MNPIAIDLGIIQIYWYSIFIFLAIFVAGAIAIKEAKRFGIDENIIVNLIFTGLPIAVLGARLYYVIFNWDYYSNNLVDIIKIWEGGLAIHGALIAAFIFCIIYCKKKGINPFRIIDITAVSFLIAQAIGRWGNFFNGEAHGPAVAKEVLEKLPIPKFVIEGMNIYGIYYHPTFFYESVWNILGFILLVIYRRYRYVKIGEITCLYLIWYSIGRIFIEMLRTDSLMIGNYKVAHIVSIILIIGGVVGLIVLKTKSRLGNLYNRTDEVTEYNV
jgi:phosphatidylglycerol:prolipoprotein diacylglycerol transferase